jgi:hypothetical protein
MARVVVLSESCRFSRVELGSAQGVQRRRSDWRSGLNTPGESVSYRTRNLEPTHHRFAAKTRTLQGGGFGGKLVPGILRR